EGGGERAAGLGEELERVDGEGRLPATRAQGRARDSDHVAEVDVHGAGAVGCAQELDATGAVDEVEEDELPVLAAAHDAAREAALLGRLLAGLELLRLGADGRDLVPIGEPLRQTAHGRESIRREGAARLPRGVA